jgi:uncharacterized protein (DUF1501 family)
MGGDVTMSLTRRQLLVAAGGAAAAQVTLPAVIRAGASAFAVGPDPATANRNRLVVIFLMGGNDGLNTVAPTGDLPRNPRASVYKRVRPAVAYSPSQLLHLDRPDDRDEKLGLNPSLKAVHRLYRDGRAAIVQGVDYPDHNYSHFESADIWQSGEPGTLPDSGWLGRHLDRAGIGEGELRGLGLGTQLPLMLRGRMESGVSITGIRATRFSDGFEAGPAARHVALGRFDRYPGSQPLRRDVGEAGRQTVQMVEDMRRAKVGKETSNALANQMLTTRALLEQNLGVECVYLQHDGFDTHTGQRAEQERLLAQLDQAIEAFFYGTMAGKAVGIGVLPAHLAARTLVMVVSEFGRRIGENGTGTDAGTDHGAAAPVLLLGPNGRGATGKRLGAGLHGDHPPLGTTAAPADNLAMTTDLRRVYQTVLTDWLADPDPMFRKYRLIDSLFR